MNNEVEQFKSNNPLREFLERRYGMDFGSTQGRKQAMASCPFHADGSRPNFSVNQDTNVWYCQVCKFGGGLMEFVMRRENLDFKGACEALEISAPKEKKKPIDVSHLVPVATYDYLDELGLLVFQVCRYHVTDEDAPNGYAKTFRQRRPDDNGGWIWNMESVRLIPYHLREICNDETAIIHIVEGEKDAETLAQLGFLSTTNVRGAGKWLDAYGLFIEGREIAIWPDNDKPGMDHAQDVFKKLSSKVKNIRMMQVPDPHKDVTDWTNTFPEDSEAVAAINRLVEKSVPLYGGVELHVYSIAELEPMYRKQAEESHTSILHLSAWLPGLQSEVRGIVPGELAVFLAATGVGKTCLLQNLAIHAAPLTTLLFELELPGELTYERFVASATQTNCQDVFSTYASGNNFNWRSGRALGHVFVCPKSALTCNQIEETIVKSELKIASKPKLVLIDYVQLVNAMPKSRYERVSEVAEKLKTIAKKTETIIFIASQISRPQDDESPEVTLYDGKDSGSIENSCGLVLGAWRHPGNPSLLKLKVLKNTKGRPGKVIDCNFDGAKMRITERGTIDQEDVEAAAQFAFSHGGGNGSD